MQNLIMKAELTNTAQSLRNNKFDQPLDIQLSSRTAFTRREISPQPLKPSADEPTKFIGLRTPIKVKMTQLSPKKIQETPNQIVPNRSKSSLLTNRQRQDQETLNQAIYQKLFQKFNKRASSQSSNHSPRRMVDIHEVYKLRQEMMEKYDQHLQSKRRLSTQNQNLKLLLKSKSERAGTKIGTSEERSILVEERKLTKDDIHDFLLRVEESQQRKVRGISQAASQKSLDLQKWKMLPKSRLIVSRSLDKNAFQQTFSSARKSKPLFEALNFSPKLTKSISKTELKREQPGSELRAQNPLNPYESTIKFEIDQIQASIRDVVRQAPHTQSLFATKYKKKINKIFKRKLEAILTPDNQIDMVDLLKLVGAITSCTVEKRLVPNHAHLQHNFETLILAILDLNLQELSHVPQPSQFIINKMLSEDKVKSAAKLVSILEPISLSLAQERRIQQHFAEFAIQLRKKRIPTVKYRTALGSPKPNKAAFEAVSAIKQTNQVSVPQERIAQPSEVYLQKRDQYLNQVIEQSDKLPDSKSAVFQKRLTQADLRSAVKSQLETRKSPDRLDFLMTGRKSVNQKSRNTPSVYSLATETQIKTVRDKSRADLAQMLQQSQSKRSSLKRPLTRQTETTPAQSPLPSRQFKPYDAASTIAAQNLIDKRVPSTGRTTKSSNAATKKQPLTSKRKVPTTTTIVLENKASLFTEPKMKKRVSRDKSPTFTNDLDLKVSVYPVNTVLQAEKTQSPKSLSIEIQLPDDHALQFTQQPTHTQMLAQPTQKEVTKVFISSQQQPTPINTQQEVIESAAPVQNAQNSDLPQPIEGVLIDQQSRPSEKLEQRRDTEPMFDQQSRPSEKIEVITDHNEHQVQTPQKNAESGTEPLSDSVLSQNQGQQIEEQGAKDFENSNSVKASEASFKHEDDQRSPRPVEEIISQVQEQDQLLQDRFSNISKKSSSQFLSNSVVESVQSAEKDKLDEQEIQKTTQEHKLTITEVGNSDAQNVNQVEPSKPKYMTFSQPSQDQESIVQAAAQEANDSIKAILNALNQTDEEKMNDDMEFNVQKQASGSEQGKDTDQLEASNAKLSPKSETAFERYQRMKKEKEQSLQNSPARDAPSSSEGKDSSKKQPYGRYTPKHASPSQPQKEEQRSWRSEVQVEQLQFNEENISTLRAFTKEPEIVEQVVVQTEKLQVFEIADPVTENIVKQETARKIKNLSFAEDLNQQNSSSQDQIDLKAEKASDLHIVQSPEFVPTNLDMQETNNENSQQLEAVIDLNIEQKTQSPEEKQDILLRSNETDVLLPDQKPIQSSVSEQQPDQFEQENQEKQAAQQLSDDLWLPDPIEPAQNPFQLIQEPKETKPKETIQGQLQAIKQGFFQFMNKKAEESPQPVTEKQTAPTSNVYGQVNDMIKRVQENIKEKVQDIQAKKQVEEATQEKPSQASQVLQSVNGMFKKVQDNVKQTNFTDVLKSTENIKDSLKPLQEKVQQSIPSTTLKSIADAIPTDTINKIKQRLPQNSIVEMVASATQNLKDGNLIGGVINAAEDKARAQLKDTLLGDLLPVTKQPVTVENPYLKIEKENVGFNAQIEQKDSTNYVDRMVAILDRLDKEYEEELKNKPKTQERKSSRKQPRDESEKSQTGSLLRKKTADSSNSSKKNHSKSRATPPKAQTPLKKAKTDTSAQKKKPESTPKQVEKLQEPQAIRKQQTYHAFPSRIVDAPEIIFFLPSWFQISGKRNKK